ncbi:hypothetical protein ACX9NE_03835 [Mycobacterium sp. ML4]
MYVRRRCIQVWRGTWCVAVAAAALSTIAATGSITRPPAVVLTVGGAIDLGQGISVTPAPGWTVGKEGPGWVTLHNAFSTAEMEIKTKIAGGTDPVAVLQADIGHLNGLSTTGLTNVRDLGVPTAKPVQSSHFQQSAEVQYSADGTSRMGLIPVEGWFAELLNTSSHKSAFVVFAQNSDAPASADGDAGVMLDSML